VSRPGSSPLERVKFLALFSSNLDEFFMVRVAMLKRQIRAGIRTASPDGLTPRQTLTAVAARVHDLVQDLREILEIQLADTVKARRILPDSRSVRGKGGRPPGLRSRDWLYGAAAPRAATT
jgi:polyphosphate kinase